MATSPSYARSSSRVREIGALLAGRAASGSSPWLHAPALRAPPAGEDIDRQIPKTLQAPLHIAADKGGALRPGAPPLAAGEGGHRAHPSRPPPRTTSPLLPPPPLRVRPAPRRRRPRRPGLRRGRAAGPDGQVLCARPGESHAPAPGRPARAHQVRAAAAGQQEQGPREAQVHHALRRHGVGAGRGWGWGWGWGFLALPALPGPLLGCGAAPAGLRRRAVQQPAAGASRLCLARLAAWHAARSTQHAAWCSLRLLGGRAPALKSAGGQVDTCARR
jgi:hypothetical protein